MLLTRREWLATGAALALGHSALLGSTSSGAEQGTPSRLIIDTHQHLWDRSVIDPPWLAGAAGILQPSYDRLEYEEAIRGLNVRSLYMEIDAAESQIDLEADTILKWCHEPHARMAGAILGGRPDHPDFTKYLDRITRDRMTRGIRRILHGGSTPPGTCLKPDFVAGIRELGKRGLTFDLCMRPDELKDGAELAKLCPETTFVVDHCGNVDPKAFHPERAGQPAAGHRAETWKRDMQALADRPNVSCKISGLVARAPLVWDAGYLAPAVNICLDLFGPDRVIFGSDWPVCLLRSTLTQWVTALQQIISDRPESEQTRLWSGNALRLYKLDLT